MRSELDLLTDILWAGAIGSLGSALAAAAAARAEGQAALQPLNAIGCTASAPAAAAGSMRATPGSAC
jgi:hypothetical protein